MGKTKGISDLIGLSITVTKIQIHKLMGRASTPPQPQPLSMKEASNKTRPSTRSVAYNV